MLSTVDAMLGGKRFDCFKINRYMEQVLPSFPLLRPVYPIFENGRGGRGGPIRYDSDRNTMKRRGGREETSAIVVVVVVVVPCMKLGIDPHAVIC